MTKVNAVTPPKPDEDAGTLDGSFIAGGNVKSQLLCKGDSQLLVKLNTQPPYDPAVVLLGIYPRKINLTHNNKTLETAKMLFSGDWNQLQSSTPWNPA